MRRTVPRMADDVWHVHPKVREQKGEFRAGPGSIAIPAMEEDDRLTLRTQAAPEPWQWGH